MRGSGRTAAVACVLAALLSACASETAEVGPACPPVSILADAASVTRFAPGPGRDLVDVDHEATIYDVSSGCEYEGDPGEAGRALIVALAPSIEAVRGPANDDRLAEFTYFVSVVDPSGTVRNKQAFPVGVRFVGNRSRVTFRDDDPPITITLPAAPGSPPAANRIYVGFQLSADELRYNRRDRSVR